MIKSAFELAMERASDIKSDKNALYRQQALDKGKQTASLLFNDADPDKNIKKDWEGVRNEIDKENRKHFDSGFVSILMANFFLPKTKTDLELLEKLQKGFALYYSGNDLAYIFEELGNIYQGYLDALEDLENNIVQHFSAALKEKEEQLSAQMGTAIKLDPRMDPKFAEALKQNKQRLDQQYQQVIEQARSELKKRVKVE